MVADSDTIFLREPEALILAPEQDAAARPVDVVGMCVSGPNDPRADYWRALCELDDVDLAVLPPTFTTVDRRQILACYNAGLVAVRRSLGVLQRTERLLFDSIDRGLRPHSGTSSFRAGAGIVPADVAELWGSSQATLAIALWATTRKVAELPVTYNVPSHMLDNMPSDGFQNAVHVHYHWLLGPSEPIDPLRARSDSPLTPEQRVWLEEELANRRILG